MSEETPLPGMELPEQIRLLETNAQALAREGRHDDAEQILRQVVVAAPRHVPALQYLASRALVRNELEKAQGYLEQAIRAAPRLAMLHQNLGIVLRARGYNHGALKAFSVALGINPDLAMVWIQMGEVLEAEGSLKEAVAAYRRGEHLFGNLAQVATQAGPRARDALNHAIKGLDRARTSLMDKALAPVRNRYPGTNWEQAERAVRMMIHQEQPQFADPLQRPAFAYLPGVPPRPFFERVDFPFLTELERQTPVIRAELENVLREEAGLRPYVNLAPGSEQQWRDLNRSLQWSSYHLYRDSERIAPHCERCPQTHAAVEALPLPRLAGQSPEVFFSILRPGTHIPPHFGLANYKLVIHLPLIIPSGCGIRVGDQTRTWHLGECLIFDDSFEHEAWNRSDSLRAVLILEAWNPGVSVPEQEMLAAAVSALDRFNRRNAGLADRLVPAAAASDNLSS